jgi:hypothetical protein
MYHDFEAKKQAVIDHLNAVLTDANLPTIRGVWAGRMRPVSFEPEASLEPFPVPDVSLREGLLAAVLNRNNP